MGEAIFGLIGVIVGGLLNGGVSLFTDHLQTRRERRTAARLLEDEIAEIRTMFAVARLTGHVSMLPAVYPRQEWDRWRATIASTAPNDVWQATSTLYLLADTVASAVKAEPEDGLSDGSRTLLKSGDMAAERALGALLPLSGSSERPKPMVLEHLKD